MLALTWTAKFKMIWFDKKYDDYVELTADICTALPRTEYFNSMNFLLRDGEECSIMFYKHKFHNKIQYGLDFAYNLEVLYM
jgi:hypothetical protein